MTGLEYGNARLRARVSGLLDWSTYLALIGAADLDHMLGLLATTVYRPEVETALPRFVGLRRLDEALRTHLASELRDVRRFYAGEAGTRLDLVLERWDLRNLRTVFRGLAQPAPADAIVPLLVPAGRLDASLLAEIAAQPGVTAALDLLVTWGFPNRETARRLLAVRPRFEETGDGRILEEALQRAFAARVVEVLADGPGDDLAVALRAELDERNLLAALRIREARRRDEEVPEVEEESFLPGGGLPPSLFTAVALAASSEEAVALVAGRLTIPGWLDTLAAWVDDGDLVALVDGLDAALTRWARRRLGLGDPLGMAVPVAYVWSKENEVRNLRLIGRGLIHGMVSDEIEERLVVL